MTPNSYQLLAFSAGCIFGALALTLPSLFIILWAIFYDSEPEPNYQ